jgi:hypothetical protein
MAEQEFSIDDLDVLSGGDDEQQQTSDSENSDQSGEGGEADIQMETDMDASAIAKLLGSSRLQSHLTVRSVIGFFCSCRES